MQFYLLKLSYPIVICLANQAMNTRENSGQIKMWIIKKAIWHISGEQIEKWNCSPYYFYYAKVQQKNWISRSILQLLTCRNDECITEWGAIVYM